MKLLIQIKVKKYPQCQIRFRCLSFKIISYKMQKLYNLLMVAEFANNGRQHAEYGATIQYFYHRVVALIPRFGGFIFLS
jgi:hypothetical protein